MNSDKRQLTAPKIREIADILRDVVRGDTVVDESLVQLITDLLSDERPAIVKAGVAIADRASRLTTDKPLRDQFRRLLRERQSIAPAKVAYELDGLTNATEDPETKDSLLRFSAAYRQVTGLVEPPRNRKEAAAHAKNTGHLESEALASLDIAREKWQARVAHYDATGAKRSEVTAAKQQSAYANEVYDNLRSLLPQRRTWPLILGVSGAALVLLILCVVTAVHIAGGGQVQAETTVNGTVDTVAETDIIAREPEEKVRVEVALPEQSLAGIDLENKTIVFVAGGVEGSQEREQTTFMESIVRQRTEPAEQAGAEKSEAKPKTGPMTILYRDLPIAEKFAAEIVAEQPGVLLDLSQHGFLPADYALVATKQNTIETSDKVTLALVLYRLPTKTDSEPHPEPNAGADSADAATTSTAKPAPTTVALERVWSSCRQIVFASKPASGDATDQVEVLRRGMLLHDSNADLLLSARVLVGRKDAGTRDVTFAAAALLRAAPAPESELRTAARDILRTAYRMGKLDTVGSRILIALESVANQDLLRSELDGMSKDSELLVFSSRRRLRTAKGFSWPGRLTSSPNDKEGT